MDLGRWLKDRKKQLEGVVAQVNPLDGNKTYSTVVNNRQPTRPQTQDTRSNVAKTFDQFNIFDSGKDFRTPTPKLSDHTKWQFNEVNKNTPIGIYKDRDQVILNKMKDINKRVGDKTVRNDFYAKSRDDRLSNYIGDKQFNNEADAYTAFGDKLASDGKIDARGWQDTKNRFSGVNKNGGEGSIELLKGRLESADKYATEALKARVQNNEDYKRSTIQQIQSNVAGGATKGFAKTPGSLQQISGAALDLVAPEGSRVDKLAQSQYDFGAGMNKSINQVYQNKGLTQLENDNPWVAGISSGVGQVASVLAPGTILGKTGTVPQVITKLNTYQMGANVFADSYNDALKHGQSTAEAFRNALPNAIVQGLLEKFGMENLMKAGGSSIIKNTIQKMFSEGSQEGLQELTNNVSAMVYDKNRGLFDNVLESTAMGGIVGGGVSVSTDVATKPVQTQPDAQSMIERIRAAKDAVLNPQPLNQTGAIQVPGGQDTQLNDTELEVINYLNNKPQVEGDATRSEGNALPSDQPTPRRQELLDRMKQLTKSMNEGGYIQTPGRTPDVNDLQINDADIVKINNPDNASTGLQINNPDGADTTRVPRPTELQINANGNDYQGNDIKINDPGKLLKQEPRGAALQAKMGKTETPFGTSDKYVYHTDANNTDINKITKEGIKPSKDGYSGPGTYLANTQDNTLGYTTNDLNNSTQYRVDKQALIKEYGLYSKDNPNGIEFDETNGEIVVPGGIKPEYVEVKKDGQWQKLKPDTKMNQQGFAKVPDLGKGKLAKFASRNTTFSTTKAERKTTTQKTQSLSNLTKENAVSSSNSKPKSRFAQRAGTSEEISPELQSQIKKKKTTYTKQTNKEQIEKSTKLVNKGYKVAASDVSSRLDSKNSGSDAQTVADTIAVIKKLDEKGNPANYQIAAELTDKLSERLTEAGQTVQAASLLYNRTPQGLYYSARRTLKKAGVELTPKLDAELQTLLKDVKSTKADSEEGQLARFKFIEKVNKSVPSGNADKAVQIWKAGLLSGPITQVGNVTANTLEQSVKRLYEDPVATGVDAIMSVFTGKRSKSLTARGIASGAQEGAVKGISYFKTGFDPRNPSQKFDVRNIHYSDTKLGRLAEGYTQTIFKSMGTSDQPFYYASMRNSLYDQAITDAKNQGLKGQAREEYIKKFITEPSKKALQLADTEARYDVFQNKTKLGEAASGLKGKTGAVGDFFIPFSGVPSSIATRIVERTPLGTSLEIAKQIKSGKFDQRQMSKAIARGTTGIVMIGIGKALAEADLFTLGFPKEDEEKKLWEVEGRQPYSIKIGGKWISLNYFQPAGTLMAAGGEYQKAKKEGASEGEAWARATASGGKALTEQSFLKGVSGVLNAVTDPKRFGETLVENTAGSTVPNWLRAPTRAFDSADRQVNNAIDSIKAGIPGLRQTLDTKVGTFGEDKQRKTSAINSLINPGRPSDVKPGDTTTEELRRLQDAGQGIMPSDIDRNSLGGETKLTDKQISELQRIINPEIKTAWDKAVTDPRYQKLDDEGKKKALRSISEDISAVRRREYAAKNQLGQYAPDYTGKEPKKLTADQRRLANGGEIKLETGTNSDSYYDKPYKERYEDLKSELEDPNNDYSDVQKIKKQKALAKLAIQKDYPDEVNDLYGLSKNDIYDYITTDKNGKKLGDQLVKLDQALYDAGRISYRKFKNGIITATASRGGVGKGGGKGGNSKALNAMQASLSARLAGEKKLRALLASTTFKDKTSGSAKRGKVAQRKITVNTRA